MSGTEDAATATAPAGGGAAGDPTGVGIDWPSIRAAYERTGEPVAAIAARSGLAEAALRSLARRQGWLRRYGASGAGRSARRALILRLYGTIEAILSQLEARTEKEAGMSSADHERETRALGNLMKAVEKVAGLETDTTRKRKAEKPGPRRSRTAAAGAAGEPADDAETLRHELAQRILKLRERGT